MVHFPLCDTQGELLPYLGCAVADHHGFRSAAIAVLQVDPGEPYVHLLTHGAVNDPLTLCVVGNARRVAASPHTNAKHALVVAANLGLVSTAGGCEHAYSMEQLGEPHVHQVATR